MEVNYQMRCCGVKELNQLSSYGSAEAAMLGFCGILYPSPEQMKQRWDLTLKRAEQDKVDPYSPGYLGGWTTGAVYDNVAQYSRFRFGIFTEARSQDAIDEGRKGYGYEYGHKFADLIRKEKLGSLVCTEKHELNPNSGQYVKVWVWGIDHTALQAWYKKNRKDKSWVQKKMFDVIVNVAPAVSIFASPPTDCGTTPASAGNGITLNSASVILGSLDQGPTTATQNR